jgi:diaminopimelate decarboxylase
MANDHPTILSFVRDRGHGVFVNSPKHLRLAIELGFEPARIVYAASNMIPEEMHLCLKAGVRLILDSLGQLQTFSKIASRGAEVGVRLSVGSALDGNAIAEDPSYRFGLLPTEIPCAINITRSKGIRIVGAHSYFGTDLINPHILPAGLELLGQAAAMLPDLQYLDAGGGFGVSTTLHQPGFNMEQYGATIASIMHEHEQHCGRSLELVLEPGRYLVAKCGFFFIQVVDIKERRDRVFVGTNGSVAIFPRPLLYPERAIHPCEIVGSRNSDPPYEFPTYICGNSTYSRDFLARNIRLPLPEPGDTLVFHNAGAYCRSMITEFLGKDRPNEIMIDSASLAAMPPITSWQLDTIR